MSTHTVVIPGCHDRTEVELTLSDEQSRQLRALAALVKRASRGDKTGCKPRLWIFEEEPSVSEEGAAVRDGLPGQTQDRV